ncbi:histidine kinase [Marilutibacter alkalisoli]|uniref:Sensor histidine kinase n=1 Tax=Marilutibacter alkalisoli TaxID=2591633 RepID=A0A514BMT1_9GAMM|nr:histidine kinase [Lysobacter alkalisoli]QDH68696.1 sensor histidine kinase [Lysobacter alkalisoli]
MSFPYAFIARRLLAWAVLFVVVAMAWDSLPLPDILPFFVLFLIAAAFVVSLGFSHLRRVRMIAGNVDTSTVANRQRRQIEIPLDADEAFEVLEAAIRELPDVESVESLRDSLQVRARAPRPQPDGAGGDWTSRLGNTLNRLFRSTRHRILATLVPGDGTSSATVVCEPESDAWNDWFRVDDGANLENIEAITRAITRRVSERRRSERAAAKQTATEKELTVAKLSLLHAQVEPHFLYNTLASAQVLTRHDPPRADLMLGHLIEYLRRSLPRTDESMSTVGDELERSRAYLEILRLRMGPRLQVQLDVPDDLLGLPMPPMMLQTLVENAIKHGLEPKPGGGTVWLLARASESKLAMTVADDGIGFGIDDGSRQTTGTGIGLKNVRERLRLTYGEAAQLSVVANFPRGVAATITLPLATPPGEGPGNEERRHG